MSRHQIPGLDPRHEVWVGWDRPLMTYFGQVYDHSRTEEENPILWVGTNWREISGISTLARHMDPYAELSQDIRMVLFADKDWGR
jgi:hypothetical protein